MPQLINLSSPLSSCKNLPRLLCPWSILLHRLYGVDASGLPLGPALSQTVGHVDKLSCQRASPHRALVDHHYDELSSYCVLRAGRYRLINSETYGVNAT